MVALYVGKGFVSRRLAKKAELAFSMGKKGIGGSGDERGGTVDG
jgi:hypothetical protein